VLRSKKNIILYITVKIKRQKLFFGKIILEQNSKQDVAEQGGR
jgi:hypothetical protein